MEQLAEIERGIVRGIVDRALVKGWRVSVWDDYTDEGERVVTRSDNRLVIFAAMGTTGGDTLRFYDRSGRNLGAVVFVWGNGLDALHDHTDNANMRAIVGWL